MENIYRTWTEFNKIQNKVISGPFAARWLQLAEESGESLKDQPYPKGEAWKYVKFAELPTTHLHLPQQDKANLQVAGQEYYSFEINNFKTPQKFAKLALPEGLNVYSDLEADEKDQKPFNQSNPFASFAQSFYGLGFTLQISKEFKGDKPIKILLDLDSLSGKDLFVQQSIRIALDANSEAEVFLDVRGDSFSGLCNLCVDLDLKKESQLTLMNKEMGGSQSHFVYNLNGKIEEQARLSHFDVTLPSRWSRHNLDVSLAAVNAECRLQGIYLNNQNYFVDHHTSIRHLVGNTQSFEDYRGILSDSAQAVFNGKILIAEKASGSNSEQINKNLMLSKKAEVDTKPELQIYNDDVKAAHGATVGQIDEEQRFYLQSRGYSKTEAGKVLARAFVLGLVEGQSPSVKKFLLKDLSRTLNQLEEAR